MLQFEELKLKLEGMKPEIDDLASALGLSQMKSEIQQLENRAAEPGFVHRYPLHLARLVPEFARQKVFDDERADRFRAGDALCVHPLQLPGPPEDPGRRREGGLHRRREPGG